MKKSEDERCRKTVGVWCCAGQMLMSRNYEEDILYDEISSGLLVREIRMQRQELLEALSLYYRVFVLQEQG